MKQKTDFEVALPLIGILLVAVVGIALYISAYVVGQLGGSVAPWIVLGLCLVPVAFWVVYDVSKIPLSKKAKMAHAKQQAAKSEAQPLPQAAE